MSVLKEKRTVSKAEYVNTANQIYVETVGFLTRLSARYSRLIAEGTAQLAGEVMDHTEKANKIYPSDEQRKAQRKAHLLEALASLSALDVRLTHAYLVMYQNPQGCFTAPSGKTVPPKEAMDKLDRMAQSPGRTDRPGGHPAAEYPGERQEAEVSHFYGCIFENAPGGRAAFPSDGGQCVVPFRQFGQQQQFLPCQHRRQRQQ